MDRVDASELERDTSPVKPLLLFSAVLVAAAWLPHHDAGRLVRGLDCALVTEREASEALHTEVMLEPSDGRTCRFVSTEFSGDNLALVIVATPAAVAARAFAPGAPPDHVIVSRGHANAMLWLEDERDAPPLRLQAERSLAALVAERLASHP
jgi:hypothetical protein